MEINLMCGECLEKMKDIPDRSIDVVLCDLPYGVLDLQWDKIIDTKQLFGEYRRICKQNSNIILFCQIRLAKELMNATYDSEFSHALIWEKEQPSRHKSCKYAPLSRYEMILIFRVNQYQRAGDHAGSSPAAGISRTRRKTSQTQERRNTG